MTKAAFQGEPGAFSEDAILSFFKYAETVPCKSFRDVFEAVSNDTTDFGAVPVENSFAGSINETYDLLLEYPLNIFREINMKINHCLLALPGETLSSISKVYSHPMAIAQCREFLNKTKIEVIPDYNTAVSARRVKEEGVPGTRCHCQQAVCPNLRAGYNSGKYRNKLHQLYQVLYYLQENC